MCACVCLLCGDFRSFSFCLLHSQELTACSTKCAFAFFVFFSSSNLFTRRLLMPALTLTILQSIERKLYNQVPEAHDSFCWTHVWTVIAAQSQHAQWLHVPFEGH